MNDETVYIFLDIDGVLNNDMARKKYRGTDMRMLNDNNLAELANLVNKINKHYLIVLISTWRYYIDNIIILKKSLNKYGLSLSDCLDIDHTKSRGELIIEYCQKRNILFNNILILDDTYIGELSTRLVKCNFKFGLTKQETENALKLLR